MASRVLKRTALARPFFEDCDVGACEAEDTEAALAAYESDLFPRAEQSAAESAANLDLCFAPDAPTGLLNFFSTIG